MPNDEWKKDEDRAKEKEEGEDGDEAKETDEGTLA
jgi:hypothetical protein